MCAQLGKILIVISFNNITMFAYVNTRKEKLFLSRSNELHIYTHLTH